MTERDDLLASLQRHRYFLRFTARDLTDEQARTRSTTSALTIGGLIKHVTGTEKMWARFAVQGPSAMPAWGEGAPTPELVAAWQSEFQLLPNETLAQVLADYDANAAATDDLVRTLDLDAAYPLPSAPWFEPGASWSVRRVMLHLIAETAQHAGHADIIRESIDGQKTMG